MAYKTLYRVYRPRVFGEVSGQEHITDILKKQVEEGKASHAYLFCGPRGTGKTSTAKILANALNCQNPQAGNPCGQCEVCKSFQSDNFVDIVEIDAASNNGVDNVRDIREKVSLLPVMGKYKVYIIDEVHMLSGGAWGALLKTLEEPPPHAVFILATTEARKVPATIMSRCQKYDFKRIGEADIVARMEHVAKEAGIACQPEALALIAQQAEGSMRDALSIMDQCIAGHSELTCEAVQEAVGIADSAAIAQLAEAVQDENAAQVAALLTQMLQDGLAPQNILRDLVAALSNELAQNARDAYKCAGLLRSLEALIFVQTTMRYSNVPGAVLLAAVMRATVNTVDVDTKDVEFRLKKLEDRVEKLARGGMAQTPQAGAPARAEAVAEPAARDAAAEDTTVPIAEQAGQESEEPEAVQPDESIPQTEPAAEQPRADAHQAKEQLEQLKQLALERYLALYPAVDVVKSLEVKGNKLMLTIAPADEPVARILQNEAGKADVAQALTEVFGQALAIEIVHKTRLAAEEKPADDVRQQLLERFGNVEIKE